MLLGIPRDQYINQCEGLIRPIQQWPQILFAYLKYLIGLLPRQGGEKFIISGKNSVSAYGISFSTHLH